MTEQLKIVDALSRGLHHEQIDRLVALHNGYRAMHGIGALAVHQTLMASAQAKVDDVVATGLFAHGHRDGRRSSGYVLDLGYDFTEFAENMSRKAWTIDDAFNGLTKSPGHRVNILRPMEHIGVGMSQLDGEAYVAVHYGRLTARSKDVN
ncbi:CAP domain-containing protein [Paenarthrobacter sp. MSM-2-10-13]|uniref:CAP domain-containing protein n=1 Tax=Paenarthrobacter sp. MSM-2-10-13 TaxID=2717318 RepID=UPI001420DCC9|nr:CAP domain-containing protein [Paenarthrobacter sp. MSM-2-10-13]NHW45946.1 CAP domain-containing protein [Paenarthrobacter sp. MSM-2-10-13]